jgi:serine/threonine protein kinase
VQHHTEILAFESLPGGWLAVAMEYILNGVPITTSERLNIYRDRWTSDLQELVNLFHSQDLVHGDLRDANVICNDDDRVFLVDFQVDWGGKVGKARYPTLNLHEELLADRTGSDLMISIDDDIRVLSKTLDKLKVV